MVTTAAGEHRTAAGDRAELGPMFTGQLGLLMDAMPDGVVIADMAGRIRHLNRQSEALFGYPRDELLGRPIETLLPERFRASHPTHRARYGASPHTRPMGTGLRLYGLRRDGAELPVEISLSPVEVDGTALVIATIRDVTERRLAEEALRRAEDVAEARARELEVILETMTDGVALVRPDGAVGRMNTAGGQLLGLAKESEANNLLVDEIEARLALYDESGRPLDPAGQPTRRVLRGEVLAARNTMRVFARRPDGDALHLDVVGGPVRDADGNTVGGVVVFRDVTEQRLLERSARAEAEGRLAMLQAVLDELPSGVYLARGRDARLVLANRQVATIWGATWPEGQSMHEFLVASGARALDLIGRELAPDELATVSALATGRSVRQQQEIIRRPDGSVLPVLVDAVALDPAMFPYLSGALTQPGDAEPLVLVVHQDVTALKEADRLKDEFITLAAHELRNPVASLLGYAQMLARSTGPGKRAIPREWREEAVTAVLEASGRLAALTDDLLDATRLQADRLALLLEPTELGALVRRVAKRLQVTTERHAIELTLPPELVVVEADVRRLEQVLTNLLSNAIKYSPDGGAVDVSVKVEAHKTGGDDSGGAVGSVGTARVAVRDHGLGIPASQQENIFGRFVRADNARERGIPGTGLGLYLCRELVERQGGRIWFESVEGTHTTFTFELPLWRGAE